MKRALVAALDEAAHHGRDAAEVEDLFVVIDRDRESAGAYLLEQCGASARRILGRDPAAEVTILPPADRARRLDESVLRLLKSAASEATRLGHDHVGTEHVIIALTKSGDLDLGRRLNEAGVAPAAAEAAMRRWIADGMPRRRTGLGFARIRPAALAGALRPLQKAARLPPLLWKIYARKSLGNPGFVSNPYPLYRWLREHEPIRQDPLAPVWILTRYDDVMEMLRNPRYLKDPFGLERLPRTVREQVDAASEETRIEVEAVSMLFLDPPNHTRVRGAFSRAFTPASLTELRPKIEQVTREHLDRVAGGGRMDLIADLAYPLPVIVIAELLGFPASDYPRIKRWSDHLAAALSLTPSSEQQADAQLTWAELRAYFDPIASEAKARPGGTLLSRLLQAEDMPQGLNREEIFSNSVLLLSAGHETTTNLIGNGMLALLRNRQQWELLTREPGLIESAAEELLRYDSPVQWTSRLSGERVQIDGQTILPGEILLGCVGAANRDPAKFSDPDRLDIRRTENKHLAFGSGIHFCLGAALARMEMQIVLRELSGRFPKMTLASRRLKWNKGLTFRGVRSLPVRLQ
jgi:cytochrome P450